MAINFVQLRFTVYSFLFFLAFCYLPDLIYGLLNSAYLAPDNSKNFFIVALLSAFLTLSRSQAFKVTILVILFLLQATQLANFQYFGGFYSAYDMVLMTNELHDTLINIKDAFWHLMIPVCVSFALLLIAIVGNRFCYPKAYSIPYLNWVFVLVLLVPFMQALKSNTSQKFQPNLTHSAIKNGLYSVSYFTAHQIKLALGKVKVFPEYQDYMVQPIDGKRPNVVVLMGESTNYDHLGIFGYDRDTTPDLTPYVDSPRFIMLPALSSAVSTRVSLALFYNVVYEPDNAKLIGSMSNSLYRLAKQQGYNTYYISTQMNAGGLTYSFSVRDIDVWKDDADLTGFNSKYDDRLLMALKTQNIDYSQPNFITLHMRSAHGPYIDNYPRNQVHYPDEDVGYHDYMVNTYDNSIRYTQKVIADIYAYFDSIGEPVYIFFVPDHGEVLGVDGRYGHNSLHLDNAKVPFLFYGVGVKEAEIQAIKDRLGCLTNHYEIGKLVARYLGFEIQNPNEKDDTYYMNGVDAFGEAGYLEYRMSDSRAKFCNEVM